jgi:ankyrin repeat protein
MENPQNLLFPNVPPEIELLILSFLDYHHLAKVSLLNKHSKQLANDRTLWPPLFGKYKPKIFQNLVGKEVDYLKEFIASFNYQLMREAIMQDDVNAVGVLIDSGASPAGVFKGGMPFLYMAFHNKKMQVFDFLVDLLKTPNLRRKKILLLELFFIRALSSKYFSLQKPEMDSQLEFFESILKKGVNVNAICRHDESINNVLTTRDVSIWSQAISRIEEYNIESGECKLIKKLFQYGVNFNSTLCTYYNAFQWMTFNSLWLEAVREQDLTMIARWIGSGFDVNFFNSEPALFVAAEMGNARIVSLLIANGARDSHLCWNSHLHDDIAALHAAVIGGHVEIIQLIAVAYSNINILSKERKTALHFAVAEGHIEAVKELLALQASVNNVDSDGKEAIHYIENASPLPSFLQPDALEDCKTSYRLTKLLIGAGAQLGNIDNYKYGLKGVFMGALVEGDVALVKLCIAAGLNVNFAKHPNLNPLGIAQSLKPEQGRDTMVQILQQACAVPPIHKIKAKSPYFFAVTDQKPGGQYRDDAASSAAVTSPIARR